MANTPDPNERKQQEPGKTGQQRTDQSGDTSKRGYTSVDQEDQETAGERRVSTEGRRADEPETDEDTKKAGNTSRGDKGSNR